MRRSARLGNILEALLCVALQGGQALASVVGLGRRRVEDPGSQTLGHLHG